VDLGRVIHIDELPGLGFNRLQDLPPSAEAPLERVRLFSDQRSSVFIRGKLLGFSSLQISVISVYQW